MKQTAYAVVALVGFAGGLVGGWMAAHVGGLAHAQEQAAAGKVITAERFEVVDAAGNRRIVIGPDLITIDMDQERMLLGSSGLLFSEVLSDETVDTSLSAKGLVIVQSGRPRLDLTMKNGEPGLRLRDTSGRVRAALGATEVKKADTAFPDRRPLGSLVLFDDDGKPWLAPPEGQLR